ncbi:MAG: putative glycoside hydrolase [Anaerolineales bacterium]
MDTSRFRLVVGVFVLIIAILLIILITRSVPSSESTPSPTNIPATVAATAIPSTSSPENTTEQAFENIQLAWFYKPPEKESLPILAENYDIFVLTHKDEGQRDTLKSLGIKSPIFVYLQLVEIRDPGSCTEGPQGNQVAYEAGDFCEISENHPDWFLLDQNGQRIVIGSTNYMDPGNAEYRAFWLERAKGLQEQFDWDGVFIDNVEVSLNKLENMGITPAKYPDDASYQVAIEGFLKYLYESHFEPNKQPVLANIISVDDWEVWLRYLQYLDGAMIEAFAVDWSNGYRSPTDWKEQISAVEQALAQRKKLILVSQSGVARPKHQLFALASYLLVADQNAYFRYADSDNYREISLYENYFLDLGPALGPRYKDGTSWRRAFTNGFVLVDPKAKSAQIQLTP